MKKKVWLILLAVVLVFGLAVLGCSDGGGSGGGDRKPVKGDLQVPVTLTLAENLYSDGYQARLDIPLKKGDRVIKDDEWTLNVKFTVSRDVPGGIQIGLVDTVTDYWNPLSFDGKAGKGEPNAMFQTEALEEGTEYTLNKIFKALKSSGGTTAAHNQLVFQTEKEYTRSEADNGKPINAAKNPGPVTITFTSGGSESGGEEDEGKMVIKVGETTKDVKVTAVKGTITYLEDETGFVYEAEPSGGYGNEYPKFKVDFGTGKTLSDYKEIKFTFQGVSGDIKYKNLYLYASETEPLGYLNLENNNIGKYEYKNNGDEPMDITLEIDPDDEIVSDITEQEVWFIINIHSRGDASATDPTPTSFIISDIEFVEADIPSGEFEAVTGIEYTGPAFCFVGNKVKLAGKVTPTTATYKTIVWSTTTSGASITGGELTKTAAGKVTLVATIVNGTAEGTDYIETFTDAVEFVALAAVNSKVEKFDENAPKQWAINEKLPFQYFVIASVNGGDTGGFNKDGFSGTQFGVQGAGVTQEIRTIGDWVNLSHTANEVVYFIIDLSGYSNYSQLTETGWKQLYINYGEASLGTYQGFVVDASVTSLTKPASGTEDFSANSEHQALPGYVTRTLPIELTE